MEQGERRVGCAGWSIPREAAGAFPGGGSHLARYADVFNAVEINSSFYRPHREQTYARWAASVPAEFRFAVKLPRAITHEARLAAVAAALQRFAAEVAGLGGKLGCVLVQLPPKFAYDDALAGDFFAQLRRIFGCMVACEARHPSWFDADATRVLAEHAVTRVIADPPAGQTGPHVPTTAAIYARLHGNPRIYYSSYEPDYLRQLKCDMATHAAAGRTVWTIFDNTAAGAAIPNALSLLA